MSDDDLYGLAERARLMQQSVDDLGVGRPSDRKPLPPYAELSALAAEMSASGLAWFDPHGDHYLPPTLILQILARLAYVERELQRAEGALDTIWRTSQNLYWSSLPMETQNAIRAMQARQDPLDKGTKR